MSPEKLERLSMDHQALLCTLIDGITRSFLERCRHLEIISQFAVGYDNIDIKTATLLKIPIGYTPDVMSEARDDMSRLAAENIIDFYRTGTLPHVANPAALS